MTDSIDLFKGSLLFIIPHMDDEVLACGGLIARLPQKESIHLIYVTNGMKSPAPVVPGRDTVSPNLGKERIEESINAMKLLGVPEQNLRFLGLPEGNLHREDMNLEQILQNVVSTIQPDFVFVPFRYDRHSDHIAINRAVVSAINHSQIQPQIVEYFVYYRLRLLPLHDIRRYIHPHHLVSIDISQVARLKRKALDCFKSQTTLYYSWQTRPILTSKLLDEECQQPEIFLLYSPSSPDSAIFKRAAIWIRIAQRIEPILQKWKYRAGVLMNRSIKHGS